MSAQNVLHFHRFPTAGAPSVLKSPEAATLRKKNRHTGCRDEKQTGRLMACPHESPHAPPQFWHHVTDRSINLTQLPTHTSPTFQLPTSQLSTFQLRNLSTLTFPTFQPPNFPTSNLHLSTFHIRLLLFLPLPSSSSVSSHNRGGGMEGEAFRTLQKA